MQKLSKLSMIKFSVCCKGENIDCNYKRNLKLSKGTYKAECIISIYLELKQRFDQISKVDKSKTC